ncbi:DNA alkylation repair protein [Arthrobacter sp. ISL-69]|uniref:DNA alkylation repair protein n=1 Tax=Arthrobacter sp. ISL-69 TaxID=2819113 RepID=UPI001BEA44B5|nr:DNA alkylation repair protein [Arthrobacter sp. ISL-69]MBT2538659.1 DNA alkylation repair protein [Arthrobacter sp. ISL-69]
MGHSDLVAAIRARLTAAADPVRAAGAQAYLKSAMPQLGVRVPEVRRIVKAEVAAAPLASGDELRSAVLELFRTATYREERYAAIDLTASKLVRTDLAMVPVYEEIIRTGAWWDLVDGVEDRLGRLLQAHRDVLTPVLLQWSTDPDFWIRRSSITAQLGAKSNTDTGLLATVIEANLADREFFIRKAIGWALREYAKTDPAWVRQFAATHGAALSPLSLREALRNLPAEA